MSTSEKDRLQAEKTRLRQEARANEARLQEIEAKEREEERQRNLATLEGMLEPLRASVAQREALFDELHAAILNLVPLAKRLRKLDEEFRSADKPAREFARTAGLDYEPLRPRQVDWTHGMIAVVRSVAQRTEKPGSDWYTI